MCQMYCGDTANIVLILCLKFAKHYSDISSVRGKICFKHIYICARINDDRIVFSCVLHSWNCLQKSMPCQYIFICCPWETLCIFITFYMVKSCSFTIIYLAFFVKSSPIILISFFFFFNIYTSSANICNKYRTYSTTHESNPNNECSQTEWTCYINDTGMQYEWCTKCTNNSINKDSHRSKEA